MGVGMEELGKLSNGEVVQMLRAGWSKLSSTLS